MPIERVISYVRTDAVAAREKLFVFGDNLERRGLKGQAEAMRGEPNAVGIVTKARPAREDSDYLTDDRDDQKCAKAWAPDFARLTAHLESGGTIVWPADGVGTGLAGMKERAPMLWEDLCIRTRDLFKLAGQENDLIIIGAGGRDYSDAIHVASSFAHIGQRLKIAETIEGGASGADTLCGLQADRLDIPRRIVMADWNGYAASGNRNGAGPARNLEMAQMLVARREQTGCRIGLLALPGGRGTANMIETAERLSIKVMPIKQRLGHEEGISAALLACKEGLGAKMTRADLAHSVIDAYARHGLSSLSWRGDSDVAAHAANLACAKSTRNPQRIPKPEYLVRDIIAAYCGKLIDTRMQPQALHEPVSEPAV